MTRPALNYPQLAALYHRGYSVREIAVLLSKAGARVSNRKVFKHINKAVLRASR